MAVRLDEDAVRAAVEPQVYRAAEDLLASGRLGDIVPVGGGAAAIIHDGRGEPRYEVWVGVVDGAFTSECDCVEPAAGDCVPCGAGDGDEDGGDADGPDLCVHAVAVTLGAVRYGFTWSSSATPPSYLDGYPDRAGWVEPA